MKHFRCHKRRPHYHHHTSQRYEDEKKTCRFAVLGLTAGLLLGAFFCGFAGAVICAVIGTIVGGFAGRLFITFN